MHRIAHATTPSRSERQHRGCAESPWPIRRSFIGLALALSALAPSSAWAQYPPSRIPDLQERSGLLMRFADVPGSLPPDHNRDNFYGRRYADKGAMKYPNFIKTQGLYGLTWKANHTESVYPYFYGSPGTNKVGSSALPWHRPLRVFQGLAEPFRPVGMYYQMGSYVPIYDLDPLVSGPGPYPYPFYFNWHKGG